MATRQGLLAQELARTNTWWRDVRWSVSDPDLAEAAASEIDYRAGCLDGIEEGGLYTLRGPRRVGRTVLVKQTVERLIAGGVEPRRIVVAAVDGWSDRDIRTLVQNTALPVVSEGSRRYWFLDEVSRCKGDWAAAVKWLRDQNPAFRADTVVLTGSNARNLTEAIGDFTGRRGNVSRPDLTLLPMGFRSFADLHHPEMTSAGLPELQLDQLKNRTGREAYQALIVWLDVLVRSFERYLNLGGYPKAVSASVAGELTPVPFLEALFTAIYRDAFRSSRLAETDTHALLERLGENLGSPLNLVNVARDVNISHDTAIRRVEDLRDSYIVWPCARRDEDDWKPLPRSMTKLYFMDPLLCRLAHLLRPSRSDPDVTAIAENAIGTAVRRHLERSGPGRFSEHDQLFYWRTPTRKEIDFVCEDFGTTALEVKYTDTDRWRSEAVTVNASEFDGILVTRNVLDCNERDRAWAVPAAILAYLLDT